MSQAQIQRLTAITIYLLALIAGQVFAQDDPELTRGEDFVETPAMGDGLCLSNLFQSNMVLQRDKSVAVWGWATPGETVSISFAGNDLSAAAADDRSWKVILPPMPASSDPLKMTVKGKAATLTLENILVGDVWVLGGQSNMEHPISRIENGELEIASANLPEIRIMTVPQLTGPEERKAFPRMYQWSGWFKRHFRQGYWDVCSPETVQNLSGIGYVFARRLHMVSQVPIGVIDTSIGGTTVEAWTPRAVVEAIDAEPVKTLVEHWQTRIEEYDPQADLDNRIKRQNDWVKKMKEQGKEIPPDRVAPTDLRPGPAGDKNRPGSCYAGLIGPLAGFSVKGAIFHQGYNNCFNGTAGAEMYQHVFPEMINAWREAFGDPGMAFGIITLCTQGKVQERHDFTAMMADIGPHIREAQYKTFLKFYEAGDKNIGIVSTYDLRRRWYHPQLKIPAGERAARWALATQYGFGRMPWKPPILIEMTVEDGRLLLKFDQSLDAIDNGLPIEGFGVAGADRKFHPAEAKHLVTGKDSRGRDQRDQTTIVLTSAMVPKPLHFRYAWARSPMGNVQSGVHSHSDVPLVTQRSDDWPMEKTPEIDFGEEVTGKLNRGQMNKLRQALRQIDLERRLAEAQALIDEHKPMPSAED